MKKVRIVAVGKIKEEYFRAAAEEYKKRLGRFCDLSVIELDDYASSDAVEKESAAIFSAVGTDFCILLDRKGELLSSEEFAVTLDKFFLTSPSATFVIGGSRGVNDKILKRANKAVSFGKMTFPHKLMRIIFLEQLYRAFTINANMPYHK